MTLLCSIHAFKVTFYFTFEASCIPSWEIISRMGWPHLVHIFPFVHTLSSRWSRGLRLGLLFPFMVAMVPVASKAWPLMTACWFLTVSNCQTLVTAFSKVRSSSICSFSDIEEFFSPTTRRSRIISSFNAPYWQFSAFFELVSLIKLGSFVNDVVFLYEVPFKTPHNCVVVFCFIFCEIEWMSLLRWPLNIKECSPDFPKPLCSVRLLNENVQTASSIFAIRLAYESWRALELESDMLCCTWIGPLCHHVIMTMIIIITS